MREKTILGGALFAGTYCIMAIMSALSKHMQEKWGFPAAELTFFNFGISTLCLLPWMMRRGGFKALKTADYPLVLLRSILGFVTFFAFFTASHKLPIVDAVTLLNTAPLWVPLLAVFIVKERFSGKFVFCILGGFVGMLLVVHPRIQEMNFTGDVVGFISGISLAGTIVLRRRLKNEPWQLIGIYYSILAAALSLIFMIRSFKMPQGIQWVFFLAMGLLMYFIQWFGTSALRYAKATVLGPLTYTSIIVSGIIGWLVWREIPTFLTVIGMLVIVVSGMLIMIFEIRENKKLKTQ